MDSNMLSVVAQLSNTELLARVMHLAELHLSEHAAYGRIAAARAVRRFPIILERLGEGSVTLTTVGLLAAHLTSENHRDLLDTARHTSKRRAARVSYSHPIDPPLLPSRLDHRRNSVRTEYGPGPLSSPELEERGPTTRRIGRPKPLMPMRSGVSRGTLRSSRPPDRGTRE